MRKLGEHAAAHGKVWVAGGDWNLEPEIICSTHWPYKLRAFVKAAEDPMGTCNKWELGSNLDYFLCDDRLKYAMGEPSIDCSVRPNPHRPGEDKREGTHIHWEVQSGA